MRQANDVKEAMFGRQPIILVVIFIFSQFYFEVLEVYMILIICCFDDF